MSSPFPKDARRRLAAAVHAPDPADALAVLARDLRDEDWSQADLYRFFADSVVSLDPSAPICADLADVRDRIRGGPRAGSRALFPAELPDADTF